MVLRRNSFALSSPARCWKLVRVGPGQSAVTVTPVRRSSRARAMEWERTKALEA